MKISKKIAIIFALLILGVIIVGIIIWHNNCEGKAKVYVSNWNGKDNRYAICQTNDEKRIKTNYGECWTRFYSTKSLDDFEKENPKDFIGNYDYYTDNYKNEAKLFYNDNNYYVIYKSEKDNVYCADCCCSVISDAVRNDIYIPTPASVNLSKEISELYDNDKDSLVGFMFDNVSFDDAVKFYSRMSEEYVTIDKTNKKITVSGFYNKDKKILDKIFTIDWNNRTYSYTDMEGKNIVYDEKGYHEQ